MDNLEGILAFCNDVRSELGREPVPKLRKGIRMDPQQCVVAGTLNYRARNKVSVWGNAIHIQKPPYRLRVLPESVKAFIDDFDNERLPDWLQGEGWAK